jgi:L-threonylcarbamoyladenylate synthase
MPVVPANDGSVSVAAGLLRAGKLVAFPTETVYGLGADALNPEAVARVFAAKGRPATNPLIVHLAHVEQVATVARDFPPAGRQLAAAFWPGPLTLVLPKSLRVPAAVTAGGDTVAVRQPGHPVARLLLHAAGLPVAAPSANRTGRLSPTTAEHVEDGLADLVLDGGPCPGGLESTVVDVTGGRPRVLRPGLVTAAELEAVVGPVDLGPEAGVARSPGLSARHYAPRTALETADTPDEAAFLAGLYETAGLKVARLEVGADPAAAAARLYADLHALDAGGYDRIVVALPPDADRWRAVRDRLTRAAAGD